MIKKMAQKPEDKYKLSGDQKVIVLQMLADFQGNNEILDCFNEEYSISLTSAAITYYKKKYEKEIIKMREKLTERILAIPIANKFYRIELRQKLIADIISHGPEKENRLWTKIETKRGAHEKANHLVVNAIMDSVKSELEPKKFAMTDSDGKSVGTLVVLPVVIGPDGKPMIKEVDSGKPDK